MRMKKTGILAGITAACICIAQTVPAFWSRAGSGRLCPQ